MQFNRFHRDFFDAVDGSYSTVTQREVFDSQITLTDFEADLVERFFGPAAIHQGNVASNPTLASKDFVLYPSMQSIRLNLVKPKLNKPELRLYLRKGDFKPFPGDVCFIYINTSNELVIGSMREQDWTLLGQRDEEDSEYLAEIEESIDPSLAPPLVNPHGRIVATNRAAATVFIRDPNIALLRFIQSGFQCEIDSSHLTFISARTKQNFVEAHHLIPMKFQGRFADPLDCLENVVSLCPNCHRKIHMGTESDKRVIIKNLYDSRGGLASMILLEELYELYNVSN